MKKIILLPIILGSALLVAGGVIFAIAVANSTNSSNVTTKTHKLDDKEFTNFDISLDTTDVEFKVSSDGSKKLVFSDTEKNHHTYKVENNTLIIKQVDERHWYEKIMDFSQLSMKVSIYLPADNYENLKIKASTSDVKIPHDFSFVDANINLSTGDTTFNANVSNSINFVSSTGDYHLNDLTAKTIKLESDTGKMYLNKVNVEEDITLSIHTGDANLTTVRAKNLNITTSTGKINLVDVVMSEKMTLTTDTGDVKFDRCDASSLSATTHTGDVTGSLLTSKTIFFSSNTGKNYSPQVIAEGRFDIKTHTGDANIQFLDR